MTFFPLPQTDLSYRRSDRYAKRRISVENDDADLDFCDLPVEVPRHERLAHQFQTMCLGFDAASTVVSAQASPQGTPQVSLRTNRFVSCNSSGARRLPRLGILARWDHCIGVSCGNGLVAFVRVVRPICGDAANILVGRDLVQEIGQHGSIPNVTAGDLDRPNLQRSSSIPM